MNRDMKHPPKPEPGNRRILIADDSSAIHDDFRKILSPSRETAAELSAAESLLFGSAPASLPETFEIDFAFQGEEALDLVKKAIGENRPYAMAFIDIRMPPGWDGLETAQRILEIDRDLQIVFCTAYSDYSWQELFQRIGKHDGVVVLKKPFDAVEAQQLAHALTEKWWLHRQAEQERDSLERRVVKRTAELRKTEELYRNAIRGAGAIPYALDYQTRTYLFIDERIEDLIGYPPAEINPALWDRIIQETLMLGDGSGLPHAEVIERIEKGELRNWKCDMRVVTRAGESKWIADTSVLEFDDEGKPVRCMGLLQDITERRILEQQVLRAQRMESIGTLAGGIAHDLNNILAPITMAVGLLEDAEKDEGKLGLISMIESSARRGADMVSQVLSFARGAEGDRERLQMKYLMRDVEKIANDTFLKSIRISSDIPSGLWTVCGDSTQLHQVLINLCVNARDAMPTGGTLTLSAQNIRLNQQETSLHPNAKPGPCVVISVQDTGGGIAPGNLDKIFDPFFSTKAPGEGTGLGLSTSLSIVKSHGGFITVSSQLGKGSEFRVYLPAEDQPPPEAIILPTLACPRGNGELVLIVDDEEQVRRMVRCVLETFGYRTEVASDGREALRFYEERTGEVDVVLTDMMMPGMNGEALIRRIRAIDPDARIIAASGVHTAAEALLAECPGIADFLPKPYSVEAILSAIGKILAKEAQPAT